MKYLSELTPAEILLITNKNATLKELLKVTLIDLLLKNVLTTTKVDKDSKFYDYIEIGKNFRNYPSKNHENVFLFIFKSDQNLKILFKNLVKVGYQKSYSSSNLKNQIVSTSKLKACISQNFLQRIFSSFSYSKYGEHLKRKILLELEQLNKEISSINNIDNRKAIELIAQIGGSIFLVGNIY